MTQNDDTQISSLQCADAIEISLYIELKGIKFYERAIKVASSPRVREIFTRLMKEEKEHTLSLQEKVQFLQPALGGKYAKKKPLDPKIKSLIKEHIFPDRFFEGEEKRQVNTDREALEIGIESEKQSIVMLEKLLVTERKMEVRAIFNHLLAEEKRHLQILEVAKEECFGS
jgi:rubrerythrin